MTSTIKVEFLGTSFVAACHDRRAFSSGPTASPLRAAQQLALRLSNLPFLLPNLPEEQCDDFLWQHGITVTHTNCDQDHEFFTAEYPSP